MSDLRRAASAGWAAFRNPPHALPRWMIESTPAGACIRGTGLRIEDIRDRPFLVRSAARLRTLTERVGATYAVVPDGLRTTIGAVTFTLQTWEEIWIVEEIFARNCYDVRWPRSCAVVDIGMNVGLAALWFASRPSVEVVYGFEPFAPTYAQAMRNFAANPALTAKIHPANVGLAAADGETELDYDPEYKGQASLWGLTDECHGDRQRVVRERVRLRETAAAVAEIAERHADLDLVLKIDCEGAEYDILPALDQGGTLGRVRCVALEWHQHGPDPLVAVLTRHGFAAVCPRTDYRKTGMIYAFR